jgi:hypothetical protein
MILLAGRKDLDMRSTYIDNQHIHEALQGSAQV